MSTMDAPLAPPMPRMAIWLGYGGLLPFLVLATASVVDTPPALPWSAALLAYGAIILSFVGALHWGFAMTLTNLGDDRRNALLVWSVVPSLLAWPALLLPPAAACVLLVMGFIAHFRQDRRFVAQDRGSLPDGYLRLRFRLTSVACLSLAAAGLASIG